ncbi:MAG: HAMP domain-containing protein, partial [Leptospirales bacterium]
MGGSFYLNFFAVSTLIPLLFLALAAIYLARIPSASRPTRILAAHFSTIALYYALVFLKSAFLDERLSNLRFLEAWPILLSYPFFLHFVGAFPVDRPSRLAKWLARPMLLIAIVVGVYGNIAAVSGEAVFRYDGHYWDLELDEVGKIVGLIMLLMVGVVYFFLIRRVIVLSGRERAGMAGIALGMLVASFIPFVTNILMFDGGISRETHHLIVNLSVTLGFFAIFIVYINVTGDRTGLLARIVGISLAAFFVLMQLIAFSTLGERESAFDRDHDARSRLLARGGAEPADLRYFVKYSAAGNPHEVWRDLRYQAAPENHPRDIRAALDPDLMLATRAAPAAPRRIYRTAVGGFEAGAFIAYLIPTADGGFAEIGYDYFAYREFIHAGARNLIYIVLGGIVFFLIGFRMFFFGTLIAPLNSLLHGVRNVNRGDLDTHLPVKVEDEIGFLSRSFNGMIESIRAKEAQLTAHAAELEDRVRARTIDLQNSLDEIQTLKKQQDGDYYLTSQLLKPLGENRVQENGVRVDFLV